MSTAYDCSAAAQYAALGAALRAQAAPARPAPRQISGLEALGLYVGSADCHPAPVEDSDPATPAMRVTEVA